jgi:hypothetical protein
VRVQVAAALALARSLLIARPDAVASVQIAAAAAVAVARISTLVDGPLQQAALAVTVICLLRLRSHDAKTHIHNEADQGGEFLS